MKKNTSRCRACGHDLLPQPLLCYRGMPKAAQQLPARADLPREKGVDLDIYQCPGCGLVQLVCAPVPYYREVIRAAAFSPEMGGFRRKQFSAFVKKYGLRGRKVLELGCGRGEYLRLMAAAGTRAYGVEHAAASVTACKAAGLRVRREFPDSAACKFSGGPFDAFFILNFLEHLPAPAAVLGAMRANLRPGGVGLIEVPDFGMMLKKNLFSEFIPDHLFYFTRATLETLLNINGFEVLESGSVWHGYILSAVVRRREPLRLDGFLASRETLTKALRKFAARHESLAVWGAGHQALAVLALAGIAGNVKYVVDSATFKQGRYTPATHLPIVPPSALDSDPVGAVIVMAAGYSDEVVKILRVKYGRRLPLAVLRERGLEILP